MIKSLCDIFDCFIDDFNDENYTQNISEIDTRSQLEVRYWLVFLELSVQIFWWSEVQFQGVFFFSCIWSLGALLNKADKEKFDVLFRALQQKEFPNEVRERFNLSDQMCGPAAKQYVYIIPDFGTVFDYQYIKEASRLVSFGICQLYWYLNRLSWNRVKVNGNCGPKVSLWRQPFLEMSSFIKLSCQLKRQFVIIVWYRCWYSIRNQLCLWAMLLLAKLWILKWVLWLVVQISIIGTEIM